MRALASARPQAPQPVAQVRDPAQRPLRARPLDDEVAGEAAVRPAPAGLGLRIGRRRRPGRAPTPRPGWETRGRAGSARPGPARRRARPPRPARRRRGSAWSGPRPSVRSRRWSRRTSPPAGRAWRRCGWRPRRRRPCPGRGRPRARAGQGAVAAHPREHARLELGDVGDHEASSRRRPPPRAGPAPGRTALPRRWRTSARWSSRPVGRTAGTGRRAPTGRSTPSRWSRRGARPACSAAAARCPGAPARAARTPGCP